MADARVLLHKIDAFYAVDLAVTAPPAKKAKKEKGT